MSGLPIVPGFVAPQPLLEGLRRLFFYRLDLSLEALRDEALPSQHGVRFFLYTAADAPPPPMCSQRQQPQPAKVPTTMACSTKGAQGLLRCRDSDTADAVCNDDLIEGREQRRSGVSRARSTSQDDAMETPVVLPYFAEAPQVSVDAPTPGTPFSSQPKSSVFHKHLTTSGSRRSASLCSATLNDGSTRAMVNGNDDQDEDSGAFMPGSVSFILAALPPSRGVARVILRRSKFWHVLLESLSRSAVAYLLAYCTVVVQPAPLSGALVLFGRKLPSSDTSVSGRSDRQGMHRENHHDSRRRTAGDWSTLGVRTKRPRDGPEHSKPPDRMSGVADEDAGAAFPCGDQHQRGGPKPRLFDKNADVFKRDMPRDLVFSVPKRWEELWSDIALAVTNDSYSHRARLHTSECYPHRPIACDTGDRQSAAPLLPLPWFTKDTSPSLLKASSTVLFDVDQATGDVIASGLFELLTSSTVLHASCTSTAEGRASGHEGPPAPLLSQSQLPVAVREMCDRLARHLRSCNVRGAAVASCGALERCAMCGVERNERARSSDSVNVNQRSDEDQCVLNVHESESESGSECEVGGDSCQSVPIDIRHCDASGAPMASFLLHLCRKVGSFGVNEDLSELSCRQRVTGSRDKDKQHLQRSYLWGSEENCRFFAATAARWVEAGRRTATPFPASAFLDKIKVNAVPWIASITAGQGRHRGVEQQRWFCTFALWFVTNVVPAWIHAAFHVTWAPRARNVACFFTWPSWRALVKRELSRLQQQPSNSPGTGRPDVGRDRLVINSPQDQLSQSCSPGNHGCVLSAGAAFELSRTVSASSLTRGVFAGKKNNVSADSRSVKLSAIHPHRRFSSQTRVRTSEQKDGQRSAAHHPLVGLRRARPDAVRERGIKSPLRMAVLYAAVRWLPDGRKLRPIATIRQGGAVALARLAASQRNMARRPRPAPTDCNQTQLANQNASAGKHAPDELSIWIGEGESKQVLRSGRRIEPALNSAAKNPESDCASSSSAQLLLSATPQDYGEFVLFRRRLLHTLSTSPFPESSTELLIPNEHKPPSVDRSKSSAATLHRPATPSPNKTVLRLALQCLYAGRRALREATRQVSQGCGNGEGLGTGGSTAEMRSSNASGISGLGGSCGIGVSSTSHQEEYPALLAFSREAKAAVRRLDALDTAPMTTQERERTEPSDDGKKTSHPHETSSDSPGATSDNLECHDGVPNDHDQDLAQENDTARGRVEFVRADGSRCYDRLPQETVASHIDALVADEDYVQLTFTAVLPPSELHPSLEDIERSFIAQATPQRRHQNSTRVTDWRCDALKLSGPSSSDGQRHQPQCRFRSYWALTVTGSEYCSGRAPQCIPSGWLIDETSPSCAHSASLFGSGAFSSYASSASYYSTGSAGLPPAETHQASMLTSVGASSPTSEGFTAHGRGLTRKSTYNAGDISTGRKINGAWARAVLKQHTQRHLVVANGRVFEQRTGITQGSAVSSLICDSVLAPVDFGLSEVLELHTEAGPAVFLRRIDDVLVATTARTTAIAASERLQTFHGSCGFVPNEKKALCTALMSACYPDDREQLTRRVGRYGDAAEDSSDAQPNHAEQSRGHITESSSVMGQDHASEAPWCGVLLQDRFGTGRMECSIDWSRLRSFGPLALFALKSSGQSSGERSIILAVSKVLSMIKMRAPVAVWCAEMNTQERIAQTVLEIALIVAKVVCTLLFARNVNSNEPHTQPVRPSPKGRAPPHCPQRRPHLRLVFQPLAATVGVIRHIIAKHRPTLRRYGSETSSLCCTERALRLGCHVAFAHTLQQSVGRLSMDVRRSSTMASSVAENREGTSSAPSDLSTGRVHSSVQSQQTFAAIAAAVMQHRCNVAFEHKSDPAVGAGRSPKALYCSPMILRRALDAIKDVPV